MTKTDAIKERLKVDLEKLKIIVTVIVLLSGGIIGLLFKDMKSPLLVVLFIIGVVWEIIFESYAVVLNNRIESLLNKMKVEND